MLAIDMMTAMPPAAIGRRLHDISAVTKRIYAETTTPAVTKLWNKVESSAAQTPNKWDAWDRANLTEMRRIHSHLSALPPELYIASVQVASEGRKRHSAAMQGQSWADIQPYMTQVVDLYRKIGELKQKKFDVKTPYKACCSAMPATSPSRKWTRCMTRYWSHSPPYAMQPSSNSKAKPPHLNWTVISAAETRCG